MECSTLRTKPFIFTLTLIFVKEIWQHELQSIIMSFPTFKEMGLGFEERASRQRRALVTVIDISQHSCINFSCEFYI